MRSPRAKLVCVSDAVPAAASELAQQWNCKAVAPEAALAAGDIDAVLIASSTDTHAD